MQYESIERVIFSLISLVFLSLSFLTIFPNTIFTALYGFSFFLLIIWPKLAKLLLMGLGIYALYQLIALPWHHPGTDNHLVPVVIFSLYILISAILIFPNALWQYSSSLALFFLSLAPITYQYFLTDQLSYHYFDSHHAALLAFCVSGIALSILYFFRLPIKYPNDLHQTPSRELNVAYFSFNGEDQCFYINADFARLFQLEPYLPIIPFVRMRDVLDKDEFHKLERAFNRSYFGHRRLSLTVKLKQIKAHYIQLRANCHGKQLHGIAFDCSKESNQRISLREQNQRLNEIAHVDTLTGLLNRYAFQEAASRLLAEAKRHHFKLGWLYLDLDWFKTINDIHSHRIGDLFLQACAQRLRSSIRAEDILCRLGGDEFFVVLNHVRDIQEATELGNKLIQTLREPIDIEGITLSLGASVGVALFPDDGNQCDQLMEKADSALMEAKKLGKGRVQVKR